MNRYFFFLIILFFSLLSCNKKEPIVCSLEFRNINIKVNGRLLNNYFTIRKTTGDTIKIDNSNGFSNNYYPVLNDNFQPLLLNKTEAFVFYGTINDSIVIKESFLIKADACHIDYVSGNTEITL